MSIRLSRRELIRRSLLAAIGTGISGLLAACGDRGATPTAAPASSPAATPTASAATPMPQPQASPTQPQGTPSPEAQAGAWDEVVAQAKQEGELVLYDGHGGALPTIGYAAEQFTNDFQIRVNVSTMRASEALERVRVEQQSGQAVADAVTVGITMVYQMLQDDVVQPIGEIPGLERVSPEIFAQVERVGSEYREYAVWEALQFYGILVNAQLVSPDAEPRSWRDLADPKWRGQIIMDDPRAIGGGNYFFTVSLKTFGREFQQALAQQQPVLTRNIADSANRVARGEFALMVPFAFGLFAQIKDLPTVKVIIPEEGAIFALHGISIPKAVRHQNAARAFVDYLLSDKVQQHLAANYLRPAVDSAMEAAPPEVRDLLTAKLWGTLEEPARVQEIIAVAQEIYP
jgi:iron(III) transport system substrate-binding protein